MCKSTLKNGRCAKYGIFCAKAHKSSEVRNLVKIYGENWKLHYDVSWREQSCRFSKATSNRNSVKRQHRKQHVGVAMSNKPMSPEQPDTELKQNDPYIVAGSPLFAPAESPMAESSNECSDFSFPLYEDLEYEDKQLGDYTDLYSENEVVPFVSSSLSENFSWTASSHTTVSQYSTSIDYRERLFSCSLE